MENIHYVIEAILGVGGFLVGLIVKRSFQSIDDLWVKHDEMTRRMTELAIDLPKNYVTKTDLTHAIDVIHDRFDKIEVKLEKIHNLQIPRRSPRKLEDTQ
mgnify:CR=1 FL=1|tara:strand:+ start:11184 stop:11483 length:300 start_codon:yes stop_codon:yes gene_type:complete